MGKALEKQEVSCLFVTRTVMKGVEGAQESVAEVLLMSKDGTHWHFPQEKVRDDGRGEPVESTQAAIGRLCALFDMTSPEEDAFLELTREHRSHKGVQTTYHIFTTDPKNLTDAELKSNGVKYIWTYNPHSYKLNACTKEELERHGFHPNNDV